jgi:ribosome-binding protein aMBF1 (putative translation factor)
VASEVKVPLNASVRPQLIASVSSGGKGRPVVSILERLESRGAAKDASNELSSASMRAGAMVRTARKNRKLSQAELAQRIGVSQERISEVERGLGPQAPTYDLLERIGRATDMTLQYVSASSGELLTGLTPSKDLLGPLIDPQ